MKSAVIFCVVLFAAVALARPEEEQYTDKYDNVDVAEIMGNQKLFDNYFNCLMDKGKCTAEGKELKGHIVDALETECAKCNQKQKDNTRLVIKHLINEKPDHWEQLTGLYDPQKKFTAKYEKELREIKA